MEEVFEVVYNDKYGGFDLSKKGLNEYNKRSGKNVESADWIDPFDPILISVVKDLEKDDEA